MLLVFSRSSRRDGITSGFLDIALNGPRVLRSAVNHLFFAIAPHPESNGGSDHAGSNHQQGHEQHQHEQDVTALGAAGRALDLVVGPWPLVVGRLALALIVSSVS